MWGIGESGCAVGRRVCAPLLILCVCATWDATARAQAIPTDIPAQPPSWTLANADLPIAQDGALLFLWNPGTGESTPDLEALDPEVRNADGELVPGHVEPLPLEGEQRYAIFRFDSALDPKGTYSLSGGRWNASAAFVATGPFLDAPLAPDVTGVEGVHVEPEDLRCCGLAIPPAMPRCFALVSLHEAQVQVRARFTFDDSSSRQYMYRATLTKPELHQGSWLTASGAAAGATLFTDQPADELCYRVEAARLTDGEQSVVAEGCVPASADLPRSTGPSDGEVAAVLDIAACPGPSQALRAAWCEVNRSACLDPNSASRKACDAIHFETLCAWYPPNDRSLADLVELGPAAAVDPAAAVAADHDGSTGASTSAEQDASPASAPAKANIDERSHDCSAGPRGAASRPAIPVLLTLFALMTAARRRRGS